MSVVKVGVAGIIIAFLIFFIMTSPDQAANIARGIGSLIANIAHGLGDFVDKLAS